MSIQHILARAEERYGLRLRHADCMGILAKIGRSAAVLATIPVARNSQAWVVLIQGRRVVAVTCRRSDGRYRLMTVFPEGSDGLNGFSMSDLARWKPKAA